MSAVHSYSRYKTTSKQVIIFNHSWSNCHQITATLTGKQDDNSISRFKSVTFSLCEAKKVPCKRPLSLLMLKFPGFEGGQPPTAFTRDKTERTIDDADNSNPITQAIASPPPRSHALKQPSSPAPSPSNFVKKHAISFTCAPMLQAMKCQLGLAKLDSSELYNQNTIPLWMPSLKSNSKTENNNSSQTKWRLHFLSHRRSRPQIVHASSVYGADL